MGALFAIILPVFLVIGLGYAARRQGLMQDSDTDALMRFAQGIAIPVLLFRAISTLELSSDFHLPLLVSFYTGAISSFALCLTGARLMGRSWEDSVAIGFCGLFSNSLLLGLAITERAYGSDALGPNYAIIAVHSPICYGLGITAMELARARGASMAQVPDKIARGLIRNPLIIGILGGMVVNISGLTLPAPVTDGLDLLARAGMPAALFGLGGVLVQYRPEGDLRIIAMVCAGSLLLHPIITLVMGSGWGLAPGALRSAVITGAMAPGINVYIFANMYGTAKRVAASSVLFGTAACVVTSALWLALISP